MLVLNAITNRIKNQTMKKYILILFTAALGVIIFNSCKKIKGHPNVKSLDNTAYLKVIHAAPGFAAVFNAPDNFNIVVGGVNGQRIAAALTYNSAFPSNTTNTNTYAAVPSGSQDIRLVLKGVVNIDSVGIATIPKNLEAGNYYTLVITDSITTTPDYSKIFTQDVFPIPVPGTYLVRFIHAVMNDTAGKKVDVYSFRAGANIFTNLSPGNVTGFNLTNYNTIPDTISIRRSGTTFELARVNNIPFNSERVYTICYRGDKLSTGTKPRGAFIYNNR
jgi:hypothetical protein